MKLSTRKALIWIVSGIIGLSGIYHLIWGIFAFSNRTRFLSCEDSWWYTYVISHLLIGILLLISSIGLVRQWIWARIFAVVFSIIGLLTDFFISYFAFEINSAGAIRTDYHIILYYIYYALTCLFICWVLIHRDAKLIFQFKQGKEIEMLRDMEKEKSADDNVEVFIKILTYPWKIIFTSRKFFGRISSGDVFVELRTLFLFYLAFSILTSLLLLICGSFYFVWTYGIDFIFGFSYFEFVTEVPLFYGVSSFTLQVESVIVAALLYLVLGKLGSNKPLWVSWVCVGYAMSPVILMLATEILYNNFHCVFDFGITLYNIIFVFIMIILLMVISEEVYRLSITKRIIIAITGGAFIYMFIIFGSLTMMFLIYLVWSFFRPVPWC